MGYTPSVHILDDYFKKHEFVEITDLFSNDVFQGIITSLQKEFMVVKTTTGGVLTVTQEQLLNYDFRISIVYGRMLSPENDWTKALYQKAIVEERAPKMETRTTNQTGVTINGVTLTDGQTSALRDALRNDRTNNKEIIKTIEALFMR